MSEVDIKFLILECDILIFICKRGGNVVNSLSDLETQSKIRSWALKFYLVSFKWKDNGNK